ncbi:hypothetical protein HN748_01345 [Candidatus Peregrinibacteria bacterium]|nr:hypothetical protein [Candidatus Peregrinibacteria bacterium]
MTTLEKSLDFDMQTEIPGFIGVSRDLMFADLAESPLARELPQTRFKLDLDGDELAGQHDQIIDDVILIRALLQASGLPKELEKNYLYNAFLLQGIPSHDPQVEPEDLDPNSPLIAQRNILPLVPYNSDVGFVQERIGHIIDHIMEKQFAEIELPADQMAAARLTAQNALFMILQQNLENFDLHPTVPVNSDSPACCSTNDFRKAVRTVRASVDDNNTKPEDASLTLLVELGVIDASTAALEKDTIVGQLKSARNHALQFYEVEMGQRLEAAQDQFPVPPEITEAVINVDITTNHKERGFFELLDFSLNPPTELYEGHQDLLFTDLNEAQALGYLTYLFFLIGRNQVYRRISRVDDEIRQSFREQTFQTQLPTDKAHLYLDKHGNVVHHQTNRPKPYSLRPIHVPGFEDLGEQLVWYKGFIPKTRTSILAKQMLKPNKRIEDLSDLMRGMLVTWGITEEELNDPPTKENPYRQYLIALAKQCGENLGGKGPDGEPLKLECIGIIEEEDEDPTKNGNPPPGQFVVKVKLNKTAIKQAAAANGEEANERSEDDYLVVKVLGRTHDGVPIEFQIVPRSTFEADISKQSPTNHKYYELKRALDLAELCFVESIHPEIHAAIHRLRKRIKKYRAGRIGWYARSQKEAQTFERKQAAREQRKLKNQKKRRGETRRKRKKK